MQAWNKNPKPFIWSATVEDIIKKIDRARLQMEQIKPGSTQPRGKKKPSCPVKLYTGPLDWSLIHSDQHPFRINTYRNDRKCRF